MSTSSLMVLLVNQMKRLIGFCCKDIPGCEGGPDETDTALSWDGGGRLLPLCTNAS